LTVCTPDSTGAHTAASAGTYQQRDAPYDVAALSGRRHSGLGTVALAACGAPQGDAAPAPHRPSGKGRHGAPVALGQLLIAPFQKHSAELTARYPKLKVEVEHTPKGR
jgi:hypothetical protein